MRSFFWKSKKIKTKEQPRMYYIVNQDKQIIAADADFLLFLNLESLQELFIKTTSGQISFDETDRHTLKIHQGPNTLTLDRNSYPITTLMGDLLLYEVSEPGGTKKEEKLKNLIESGTEPKEEKIAFIKTEEESEPKAAEEVIEPTKIEVRETIDFLKSKTIVEEENPIFPPELEKKEDFTKSKEEYAVVKEEGDTVNLLPDEGIVHLKPEEDAETLVIDAEAISKTLGISREDYAEFLNEFIDKAIEEEDAVKNSGNPDHEKAVTSLYKLSQMLHLTALSNILEKVTGETEKGEKKLVEQFYHSLSNLTAYGVESAPEVPETEEKTHNKEICHPALDEVKPIHFDFQPKQASDELGLPGELIIEFAHDFIVQAHEAEKIFFDACKKGDIDTIHRTAHKLKGVASNLRIIPLAETLEELQFCEDTSRFEPLLKKYWGQLLTLQNLMRTLTGK